MNFYSPRLESSPCLISFDNFVDDEWLQYLMITKVKQQFSTRVPDNGANNANELLFPPIGIQSVFDIV